jgi:HSP20 family molecular chaperone IbpA
MAVTKYDPFESSEFPTGLRLFQDAVNRLFSEPAATLPWAPPVDIVENENENELPVFLAGCARIVLVARGQLEQR